VLLQEEHLENHIQVLLQEVHLENHILPVKETIFLLIVIEELR
jgi:hypothetical protein